MTFVIPFFYYSLYYLCREHQVFDDCAKRPSEHQKLLHGHSPHRKLGDYNSGFGLRKTQKYTTIEFHCTKNGQFKQSELPSEGENGLMWWTATDHLKHTDKMRYLINYLLFYHYIKLYIFQT